MSTLLRRLIDMWYPLLGRDTVYVGWIRATNEYMRNSLQYRGISGLMQWRQETITFGAFEYCKTDKESLINLYQEIAEGHINVYIGGFNGIWEGTGIQVPRRLQHFWHSRPWQQGEDDWTKKHGYTFDIMTTYYVPVREPVEIVVDEIRHGLYGFKGGFYDRTLPGICRYCGGIIEVDEDTCSACTAPTPWWWKTLKARTKTR